MSRFFESSVVPAARPEGHVRPEDQVSWRLADERLERRERAAEKSRRRKEERP